MNILQKKKKMNVLSVATSVLGSFVVRNVKKHTYQKTNDSRLEAVANFGNVNFPLLLNFLRKINAIKPHILPLLSNRCYAVVLF